MAVIIMLTLETIRDRVKPVAKKYAVVRLELFGSYADGTADENSDADFLARFAAPVPSIFKVMGFREELSQSLGLPVDVVTLPLAHPEKLRVSRTEKIL
ncbi:MAG: nucleotidyltransferase domain-containing protein [Peptococcaceae bacterium]|jgi:predicted nucleotidyltransferase|nr:nucleotidyltransferase domain-containing protein [Peptococcaceae bacterium]